MSDTWDLRFIDDPKLNNVALQIQHKKTHFERTVIAVRTDNESNTLAAALEQFAKSLRERQMGALRP